MSRFIDLTGRDERIVSGTQSSVRRKYYPQAGDDIMEVSSDEEGSSRGQRKRRRQSSAVREEDCIDLTVEDERPLIKKRARKGGLLAALDGIV